MGWPGDNSTRAVEGNAEEGRGLLLRVKPVTCTTPQPAIEYPLGMTSPRPTSADYLALKMSLWSGEIRNASKPDLERYAVMLSLPNAYAEFGEKQYQQVCETVRTLLVVRMSEEANAEATRISLESASTSKTALGVAWAAFVFSVVQAILAVWNFLFPTTQ